MYNIKFSAQARREFKKLKIHHRIAVNLIVDDLKDNPYVGKKLSREYLGRYSYRISVYRIIYKISETEETVTVITIGHRSEVYN